MLQEAKVEVESINPFCRRLPKVLAVRLAIYRRLAEWDLMAGVARKLVEWNAHEATHFVDLAYATRRARSLVLAQAILVHASHLHPEDALIQFNLACFKSQLGNLSEATAHLTRAAARDKKFILLALCDPDLKPLWTALSNKTKQ